MDIKHSRRILAVGAPDSGVLDVIKELTGSSPPPDTSGSTAGLTHEWTIKTAYYTANVPIWIDEILDLEAWKTEFLKPEAREVVEAVGAWLYCFRKPADGEVSSHVEEAMRAIHEIVEEGNGYGADAAMLAVAVPVSNSGSGGSLGDTEAWEDACMGHGFEYVDFAAAGTNEFGEKVGVERLREGLEANDWTGIDENDDDIPELDFDNDDDDILGSFGAVGGEMTSELFGMKAALMTDDFEPQLEEPRVAEQAVEALDRMMGKLLAVRENSADLPDAQRKRLAARAVKDLLK